MKATSGKAADATLTERLANYWAPARYEDLPVSVVALAKRFLLDNLGAAIAGAKNDVTLIALEAARARRGRRGIERRLRPSLNLASAARRHGERHRRARLGAR